MFALLNLRAASKVAPLRHLHTASTTAPHFNIAFDIDGVLIKGKQVIPQTRRALELLQENKIPYIFLTNGGGTLESEKADQLTKKLGLYVNPEHLIVSHSPMRSLVSKYRDANVMVVGGEGSACKHAAHDYGFKNVVTPEEIHSVHPSVCPISTCETRAVPWTKSGLENVEKPVDAVMVFHDSNDWGRDLQLCLDALVSKGGKLGTIKDSDELHNTKQTVPIYFSNPDIVWSNEYPVPRFGQGTFRVCLEKIYQNLTGQPLEYVTYGKPMNTTYQYAESLLEKIDPLPKGPDGKPARRTVYAVGDNPYADIAGANGYGWDSVLVKTGVFRPKGNENHHVHPATTVVDHVEDAVRWIIARENMKQK
ncbi:hypothetical protein BGX29_000321 [Mortierella sp. GBA35]|nr:hypothetical protein BGX23_010870 [Mortierella sp. AD031]KAF9088360.1 hypothetical protein BGX29_000321 [Mortierella sp. GBA35]KAG0211878.1 hypothetical protein BGX33_004012 [Mortierella sp. NVP41]